MKGAIINLHFNISAKKLEKALHIPKVVAGILKDEVLLDFEEDLRVLARLPEAKLRVKHMGTVPWEDSKKRKYRVSDSFSSVVKKTPLLKYIDEEIGKYATEVFLKFLRSNQTPQDVKRYRNGLLAIFRKSYVSMAMRNKCSRHREQIKGHALYAIGTGQTLSAVKARVVKE